MGHNPVFGCNFDNDLSKAPQQHTPTNRFYWNYINVHSNKAKRQHENCDNNCNSTSSCCNSNKFSKYLQSTVIILLLLLLTKTTEISAVTLSTLSTSTLSLSTSSLTTTWSPTTIKSTLLLATTSRTTPVANFASSTASTDAIGRKGNLDAATERRKFIFVIFFSFIIFDVFFYYFGFRYFAVWHKCGQELSLSRC